LASTTLGCTVHLRARRTVGRFGNLRYSRLGSLRYGGRVDAAVSNQLAALVGPAQLSRMTLPQCPYAAMTIVLDAAAAAAFEELRD